MLVCTVVNFVEPRYGTYVYPWWAILLGWFLALVSLVPIPVIAVYKIIITPGSFREVRVFKMIFSISLCTDVIMI